MNNEDYDEPFRRSFGWTVLLILFVLPLAVWLLFWLSNSAGAQGNPFCLPAEKMEAFLLQKFQEEIVAAGVNLDPNTGAPTGTFTEVYASPNGMTWTIVEILSDKTVCLRDSGQNWVQIPFVPPRAPDPPRSSM